MHDDDQREPSSPVSEPESSEPDERADWARAEGVSREHVFEDEPAPRLHWALIVLGPLGLAGATSLSLWSSSQQVERSVHVQVESKWQAGERVAMRTQVLAGDLRPLIGETHVTAELVDATGQAHLLGELVPVADGLAQGSVEVPALAPGEAELRLSYTPAADTRVEPFAESVAIEVVERRPSLTGKQVVAENNLQWGDDTDPQLAEVRIDLRFANRLLAGFNNTVFVRVTDPQGKPWAPEDRPRQVQVRLVSGEWNEQVGKPDAPVVVFEGELDRLGLASFTGLLTSDVVRFEVRLPKPTPAPPPAPPSGPPPIADTPPAPPAPTDFSGPSRKLRFVSHAGTVRLEPSTDFAGPGSKLEVQVEALSSRKPVFIDIHGPAGGWLSTITPPLLGSQAFEWQVPESITSGLVQFEAYQSVLSPEDSSALVRVQIATLAPDEESTLDPLIERQREQLKLPRIDREFEVEREKAYLGHIEAATLEPAEVGRARSFLLGSLETVVYGPPLALNTRPREDQSLAEFKRRWTTGIRWFLLGGGGLFIVVLSALVWRNQKQLEQRTTRDLGLLDAGGKPLDEEEFAAQSLMLMRGRRQVLARGVLTIALAIATLLLTVTMLEAMVWEY